MFWVLTVTTNEVKNEAFFSVRKEPNCCITLTSSDHGAYLFLGLVKTVPTHKHS